MSIQRPGDEGVLVEAVRRRLAGAGRSGLPLGKLAAGDLEEADLADCLEGLVAAGEVVEWNHRFILLERTPWRQGRLQSVSGGDGVVWPSRVAGVEGQSAFFVPRKDLKRARDGDLVLVQPRRSKKRRPAHRLPEAAVVRVLTRRSRLVGRVDSAAGYRRLIPFDHKVRLDVELSGAGDETEGRYVVAELDSSPGEVASRASGRITEILGRLSEPGVDVLVALRHFEIPEDFPPEVVAAAEREPSAPPREAYEDREDLRQLVTVTVDGETARDFDDAISIEPLAGGGARLGVHIADVSHYVPEGSRLDLEAYRRGTSVYFPERAVPMLPEGLSNGLCSLRPDEDRLTLSVFLDVDPAGDVRRRRFAETVIRSHRRLTYAEVRRILEEPAAGDDAEYGAEVLATLSRARDLMKGLHAKRQRRGSIDFDLPSGDVILDTDGVTVGVKPGERTVAHRIIEECMIAANEAVAEELFDHEVSTLYRVHESPSEERVQELAELLGPFGLELEVGGEESLPSRSLQRALEAVAGHPEESFVASVVLQAMQRARYHPSSFGHYALASAHYAHFTSPIRRYPDLLVHRRLRNHLRGRAVEVDVKTLLAQRLPAIAERTSTTERRAERAERLVLHWKALRLLQGREGETLSGRVTAVKEFGLFVRLVDEYVDGLVPVASLGDDYYEYDEERHRLVGQRRGRVFRLADEVRVVLSAVDVHRRMVDLTIEDMPPGAGRRERGRPERGARRAEREGPRRQGRSRGRSRRRR